MGSEKEILSSPESMTAVRWVEKGLRWEERVTDGIVEEEKVEKMNRHGRDEKSVKENE